MRKVLQLLILTLSINSFGQAAIINDPDGYTNVREKADGKSTVIHRIYQNQVFWIDYVEDYDETDWVPVFIPKNMFSLYDSEEELINGFIHKSRIQRLENLPLYEGPDFSFRYLTQPFNPDEHHIELYENKWVTFIDGRKVWGTDGNNPRKEVTKIEASVDGNNILIHPSLFSNLYECDNSFKVYKKGNIYFVEQWNSDGAGAYQLVWVLNKDGVIQRLVGSII